jgi:ribose transport system permease protein
VGAALVGKAASPRGSRVLDRVLDGGILLALIALIAIFSIVSPQFLTVSNILNILDASSIVGIVAVAVTIALIAGQFDLSVGSVVGFSSALLAVSMASWGMPVVPAMCVAFGGAMLIGVINGILVVNIGINSIIATLGMLAAVRGVAFVVASGSPIPTDDQFLNTIGIAKLLGVPVAVWVMALVYTCAWIFLSQTRIGLHTYAVGGNIEAAERAGVATSRIIRLAFLVTAAGAAIGAVLITARTFSGQAVYGRSLELDALTAVLLGGVGLRGGEGTVGRTLVGVAIVGVITNGLVLTQVEAYWTDVARGVALITAVILQSLRERRGRA